MAIGLELLSLVRFVVNMLRLRGMSLGGLKLWLMVGNMSQGIKGRM